MNFLSLGSINKNLALLVGFAVLPALIILLYSGLEQRRHSIENAKQDVLLLTHTMAAAQQDITRSSRQILTTLSLLPAIQAMDLQASTEIFRPVLEKNPEYSNISLTDLNGEVVASGRPFTKTNLADRLHFRDAVATKDFAIGEYIITRTGPTTPAFAFAYPVLDNNGMVKAVLTMAIKQDSLSRFHDVSTLPEKSFVAVTDGQGIRLFYYPPQEATNPIGAPIQAKVWAQASKALGPGILIGKGSDGIRRIVAFEQVRLSPQQKAYSYVWAGIPEAIILAPANAALTRNLLLMLLATLVSLGISWLIGKNTFISPIKRLVSMTRKFSQGNLEIRCAQAGEAKEFSALTTAFHDMADALLMSSKTLQENEARFRLVMNSLEALVYVADMETYEILFINEYGMQRHGNITGKICWQSLHKGQSGPCPFCTNKYLLDDEGKPGEMYRWEFQNSDSGQWFQIHDRAIKWLDDRIVRLEVATDISERKEAETRLAEETERLAVTLRSIGDGVITTDTQGRVVLINKVAEALTGWDSKEATQLPFTQVFTTINAVTRQPCDNPLEKILNGGEIPGLARATLLVARNGQERNIAASGAPIRDNEGKTLGMVVVFRDITEQLRTEQELIKGKKLESVGVLAGGIAHDFNNILAAILGNIDLALLDANISVETKKLLNDAIKASYRARDLTLQLLTFSKGGEPIKEAASLVEVVKDSADFILRGGKVACRYLFPDDLWLVNIDKGQISQVVQNIILNATNAMAEGGIIEVSAENVSAARSRSLALPSIDTYVKLEIKDSGVGIPADMLDKIFDPYFSTKEQGSGLGLAITHSIVSKHGGHITAQSTPGMGTTVTVYLLALPQSPAPLKIEDDAVLSTKKSTIMVMDDEEMVRLIAQEMLSIIGHEVILANDGVEAIQLYQEAMASAKPIDVIIMDLTIPGGMGGTEAVQKILAIDPKAKVIVSSGYSKDPVLANFQDYGFCAAIAKPYQLLDLARVINQLPD